MLWQVATICAELPRDEEKEVIVGQVVALRPDGMVGMRLWYPGPLHWVLAA